MTTPISSAFVGVEQILLLLFVSMLLAGIAGANPGMVLKPVFEIVAQILMLLISLLSQLLIALFRVVASALVSGTNIGAERLRSGSLTRSKR